MVFVPPPYTIDPIKTYGCCTPYTIGEVTDENRDNIMAAIDSYADAHKAMQWTQTATSATATTAHVANPEAGHSSGGTGDTRPPQVEPVDKVGWRTLQTCTNSYTNLVRAITNWLTEHRGEGGESRGVMDTLAKRAIQQTRALKGHIEIMDKALLNEDGQTSNTSIKSIIRASKNDFLATEQTEEEMKAHSKVSMRLMKKPAAPPAAPSTPPAGGKSSPVIQSPPPGRDEWPASWEDADDPEGGAEEPPRRRRRRAAK